ncbi:polysaccharide biosynthesis protein [Amphritea balenae]|uniref:Polysaccharide biosynthesis protein n=1 Tax=Amphritea balenae TaxID=452629 RepID=A0A3P1SQ27_9GAMM|nr:nucleoside-diphosphate sugar epimerase/dehydratase [Amphritea balenae]RRC99180.1 polysaccharide biosynthesis protein [Amphritea balenae]
MLNLLLNSSRNTKKALFLCFDVLVLPICCWLSFALRYEDWTARDFAHWPTYLLAPVIAIPFFIRLGLYRAVIRYIGYKAQWTVLKAVTLFLLVWTLVSYQLGLEVYIPRSVFFIFWFIAVFTIGGSRMLARWVILQQFPGGKLQKVKADAERVLIYGAGAAGRQLANALEQSSEFLPVGFIDDNPELTGLDIHNLGVYRSDRLFDLIDRFDIDTLLLAMPSASRYRKKQIIDALAGVQVRVLTLPVVSDLAGGRVSIDDIKEVDIADLLGREEVQPQQSLLDACIKDQAVLVSGAGGSIGSELCRQIICQKPSVLILLDQSEFALYSIEIELSEAQAQRSELQIVPVLGSVLDEALIDRVLAQYNVDTIYHAAAYKHVPLVENNTVAGLRNNVIGTLTLAQSAVRSSVKNFVLISTDKAVRPTNVMGASKRFAELILQGLSKREVDRSGIRFAMVRFGNVLGSSGSVIPLFRRQIKAGGPVTVTDPEITRYFMTIPEAASLVIQAGSMGSSGDVYVLDMGEPVKIYDLARQMVNLTGLSVRDRQCRDGDIEIRFTGLRDGEKLYEELLIGGDVLETDHPKVMRAQEEMLDWRDLEVIIHQLSIALDTFNHEEIQELLLASVNGYDPKG